MSKSLHLRRKSGTYHWRRRIPPSLTARFRRSELIRSLCTADPRKARVRGRMFSAVSDKLFAMVESNFSLTSEEIESLAKRYFEDCLEMDEFQRTEARPRCPVYTAPEDDVHPIDADLEVLSSLRSDYQEALAENRTNRVSSEARAVLADAGKTLREGSPEFNELARGILRATVEVLRIAEARREGDYTVKPEDPLFVAAPAPVSEAEPSGPPISGLFNQFLAERIKKGEVRGHYVGQNRGTYREFVELHGDLPVDKVKRQHLTAHRDALRELPSKHGQLKGWKELTLKEKLAKAEAEELPEVNGEPRSLSDLVPEVVPYARGIGKI